MSIVTQGYGNNGAITTQGYGVGTGLIQLIKAVFRYFILPIRDTYKKAMRVTYTKLPKRITYKKMPAE